LNRLDSQDCHAGIKARNSDNEKRGEKVSSGASIHLHHVKRSRSWKPRSLAGRMPASTVAARFQRASEGGILPPIVKAVPAA
jgi:hypothetical protein